MDNRYPYYNPYRPGKPPGNRQWNGHAIASMILGICSIVFMWTWLLSIACGIAGLVLGFNGMYSEKAGMGKAGVITSIVGLGIAALTMLWSIFAWL